MSTTSVMTTPLDLTDIQGDILSGLPKKTQTYIFFQITDPNAFRLALSDLVPLITSTEQVLQHRQLIAEQKAKDKATGQAGRLIDIVGVNIAFSRTGLVEMGITDDIGDAAFTEGQLADAENLGDKGSNASGKFTPSNWDEAFLNPVHGVILLSGPTHALVHRLLRDVERIFGVGGHKVSIKIVKALVGDVRPGAEKGHEHFGFLDGISQPAVAGFGPKPNPGQETIPQGIMLVGRDQDPVPLDQRPKWAVNGSFLALRYLSQLVPEFDKFLTDNPIDLPGLTRKEGSELLGARLVGRWKSGAPVDITPLRDSPALGSDPSKNNDFRYQGEQDSQTRCPFAAHIRKTNPRATLEDAGIPTTPQRIIRRGIQFGPELTVQEKSENKTHKERGLIFVAYQSSIVNGFQFLQKKWANNSGFPPKTSVTPGLDPIIGQTTDGGVRQMSGANPREVENDIQLPVEFVVSKGGEYFFSPSISALRDSFAFGVQILAQDGPQ